MSTRISDTHVSTEDIERIHLWQTGRAMRHVLRAYPPGTDAMIDGIRASGFLKRFMFLRIYMPFYFAREQGWMIRGERGGMAAMMYLRHDNREGIRVLHVDEISVDASYRGRGYARRLMQLAEDIARAERLSFLKLAVTVANIPAVTLYHQLGYQELPHHYLTYQPGTVPPPSQDPLGFALRPLDQRQAVAVMHRVGEMELNASMPALAPAILAHYPLRVPSAAQRIYALDAGDQLVGYAMIDGRDGRWNLRVGLHPSLWGSESECHLLQRLTHLVTDDLGGYAEESPVTLHVPSDAHIETLSAGPQFLATRLGLETHSYNRMVMAKVAANTP